MEEHIQYTLFGDKEESRHITNTAMTVDSLIEKMAIAAIATMKRNEVPECDYMKVLPTVIKCTFREGSESYNKLVEQVRRLV